MSEAEIGGWTCSLTLALSQTSMCSYIKVFGPFSVDDGVDDWRRRESLLMERLGAYGE